MIAVGSRLGARFRQGVSLDDPSRGALLRVLTSPAFEVLPLDSTDIRIGALPAGADVTVTASPSKPIERTIELAERLQGAGFHAVPHLSARMVRDTGHLRELLSRTRDAGIIEVFVVGGDGEPSGDFPDGLSLLRALTDLDHGFRQVGIPCYPDGHASIPDEALLDALRAKAAFATYMTTQLCFDAGTIDRWIRARRSEGFALPVVLGVPGSVEPHRLLAIGARIGVRDTRQFVLKNLGLVGRLLRSGGFYRPDELLAELAPTIADPAANVRGLHIYTFNQLAATESWRADQLATLRRSTSAA